MAMLSHLNGVMLLPMVPCHHVQNAANNSVDSTMSGSELMNFGATTGILIQQSAPKMAALLPVMDRSNL